LCCLFSVSPILGFSGSRQKLTQFIMDEMSNSQSPNFQDRLHFLLLEAEQFVPGSTERTNSLEQIRSILMDRGSTMRQRDGGSAGSHPGRGSHGSRSYHSGGAIISPSDDGHILDDYYLGHETAGTLHSIPEASDPSSDRLWDTSHSMAHFTVKPVNTCTWKTLLLARLLAVAARAMLCKTHIFGLHTMVKISLFDRDKFHFARAQQVAQKTALPPRGPEPLAHGFHRIPAITPASMRWTHPLARTALIPRLQPHPVPPCPLFHRSCLRPRILRRTLTTTWRAAHSPWTTSRRTPPRRRHPHPPPPRAAPRRRPSRCVPRRRAAPRRWTNRPDRYLARLSRMPPPVHPSISQSESPVALSHRRLSPK
jgi:hypothetical protein